MVRMELAVNATAVDQWFGTECSAALQQMMALPRSHEGCGASDRGRTGSFTGTPMGGEFDLSGQTLLFASLPY
jgi:hypothetical protein